jgi:hypothetical protein
MSLWLPLVFVAEVLDNGAQSLHLQRSLCQHVCTLANFVSECMVSYVKR